MEVVKKLIKLFSDLYGDKPESMQLLPGSGSHRIYYKMTLKDIVALGSYNQDIPENRAFFYFTEHFKKYDLPVPSIYAIHNDEDAYLQEYLGEITLYDYLTKHRSGATFSDDIVNYYKKVLEWLPIFQTGASKDIDYSMAYPRHAFDEQSMQWDLNYFKYYFIKLSGILFDEQRLEYDFQTLIKCLHEVPSDYFLYRDFQSRNIMIKDGKIYFIDYQGGRKGALQYDIASLLWDAKADIPRETQFSLLEYYLKQLSELIPVDKEQFKKYYYVFVLARILQALGTYGYRGFYENKPHFLQSIPFALDNLKWLFDNTTFPIEIPELSAVLKRMIGSSFLRALSTPAKSNLTVTIHSFSYHKGIPYDPTGNGGGHVFDCRIVPNPGRKSQFKELTGRDKEVKDFLDNNSEVEAFFQNIKGIVLQSVENYLDRRFTNLMLSFGCTGGQHRSVYFSERTAQFLRENYPKLKITLFHNEQKHLNEEL